MTRYLLDYFYLWTGGFLLVAVVVVLVAYKVRGKGSRRDVALVRVYLCFALAYVAAGLGHVTDRLHLDARLAWAFLGLAFLFMAVCAILLAQAFLGTKSST